MPNKDTKKKIEFLLAYGVLAPSSHNSQPWAFRIEGDSLKIYADMERKLEESDKESRMLSIALGCLITNLKIAADYFSFSYNIEYCPIDLTSQRFVLIAKINFQDGPRGQKASDKIADYFRAISERRSNRNKYKDRPISAADLEELKDLNKEGVLKIDFVSDGILKSQIAEISSRAMGKVMSDSSFRRELAFWLRTNWTLKRDGMPGNGHGMSLPISFAAPFILRHVDVSRVEAEKEKMRILNFSAIGIISSQDNNSANWLKAGELLEMILLAAQAKGIDCAIRVASIEFPEGREQLRNVLGIKNFTPQILFGLGYAEKAAPHSPRRKIEDLFVK